MVASEYLTLTPAGLYCSAGDFYIDPLRPVPRALITHGHSDHARPGHGKVLATPDTLAIMAIRCGPAFANSRQPLPYGDIIRLGEVEVSFHPAGHVLGSAQILLCFGSKVLSGKSLDGKSLDGKSLSGKSLGGKRIVVSGDYKRQSDPTCAPFEPVRCDCFITEATFGLPVFRHPDPAEEIGKLLASLQLFPERCHIVGAYALGKAQRVLALLRAAGYDRPIFLHGSLVELTNYYASTGLAFGDLRPPAAANLPKLGGEIVLCPPMALENLALRGDIEPRKIFASGWMRVRARARQRGIELPLVISDHADWDGLCRSVVESGCQELLVTHGESDALVYWAQTRGMAASPLHLMGYGHEDIEGQAEAQAGSPGEGLR